MYEDEDTFASVAWDTTAKDAEPTRVEGEDGGAEHSHPSPSPSEPTELLDTAAAGAADTTVHLGDNDGGDTKAATAGRPASLKLQVQQPVRELEGTKDTFVSYQVVVVVGEEGGSTTTVRRRFQDFVFLHDQLCKDFAASVVPPLPDKSRIKYVTGERFSPEFVERRRVGLERFLQRLARHPVLCRSSLLQLFIESNQWNVDMHTHLAHPPVAESASSFLEMASDTLLNAFSKVRKPDERFVDIKQGLDRFEERLSAIERIENRCRTRTNDLASDYDELAASIQGLGYLESGITDPLARFEAALLDASSGLRDFNTHGVNPFLERLVGLNGYSESLVSVLKLRDQKQLDFEDLSAYLSNITTERDRLAAGYSGLGLGSYLKEKMEMIRSGGGASEVDYSREAKIHKHDVKIKALQDAVTTAHEISDAFNEEVLKEHSIFQQCKREELKEILNDYADSHIAMYKKSIQDWEGMLPTFERIRVDN